MRWPGAGVVHVWRIELDPAGGVLEGLAGSLDERERGRAERFRQPGHGRRFRAGRGSLRAILGGYLGCPAAGVRFAYGVHGKPALADDVGLKFNLAHSHERAMCAVTVGGEVGVDLEQLRPMGEAERIVGRYFSAAERAAFTELAEGERLAAFFRVWTRKEAFLKAVGTGLATALDSFDVSLEGSDPRALRRVGDDPGEAGRWSLVDVDAGAGYAAAVAVAGAVGEVVVRDWPAPGYS